MDYSLNRISPRSEQAAQPSQVTLPSPRIVGSDIPRQRTPGHTPKLAHTFEKSPVPAHILTPSRAKHHSHDTHSSDTHSHNKHHDSDKHHESHNKHHKHDDAKHHKTPSHPTAVMSSDLADKYQNLINVLSPQPVTVSPKIVAPLESPKLLSQSTQNVQSAVSISPKIAVPTSAKESPKLVVESPRAVQSQSVIVQPASIQPTSIQPTSIQPTSIQPAQQPTSIQPAQQPTQAQPQAKPVTARAQSTETPFTTHDSLLHHVRIWPSMWPCLQGAEVFIKYRAGGTTIELAEQVVGKIYPVGDVMYFSLTDLTPKTRKVNRRIPFDDVVEVWKRYPAACVPEFLLIQASMRKYDAEIAKLTAANAKLMEQVVKLTAAYGAISK